MTESPSAAQCAETAPERAPRRGAGIGYVLASLLLAASIGLCVFISFQVRAQGYVNIGGFSLFRVVTGSMEPTISAGELLLCRTVGFETVAVGDIVCYRTELSQISDAVITHRVVEIVTDESGTTFLLTQGDANLVTDAQLVQREDLVGRVVWYSGKESVLNDILAFLTGEIGFLTCIVFPVLLAAGLILQSSVKNLYQEIARFKRELADADGEEPEAANETNEKEKTGTDALPGYTMLTQEDYEEILQAVRAELMEGSQGYAAAEENDARGHKTE